MTVQARPLKSALLGGGLAVVLAACGGGDDAVDAPARPALEVTTTETRAAPEASTTTATTEAATTTTDAVTTTEAPTTTTTTTETPTTTTEPSPPALSFAHPVEFNPGGATCPADEARGTIQMSDFEDESIVVGVPLRCVGLDWHVEVERAPQRDTAVALLGCADAMDAAFSVGRLGDDCDLAENLLLLDQDDPAAFYVLQQTKIVEVHIAIALAKASLDGSEPSRATNAAGDLIVFEAFALARMLREYAGLA